MLPYTSIQSDLITTSPLVVLPYTSIQSDLITTSPLVVLPYTSKQSDLSTTPPLVPHFTSHYNQFPVVTNTIVVCGYIYAHKTCCCIESVSAVVKKSNCIYMFTRVHVHALNMYFIWKKYNITWFIRTYVCMYVHTILVLVKFLDLTLIVQTNMFTVHMYICTIYSTYVQYVSQHMREAPGKLARGANPYMVVGTGEGATQVFMLIIADIKRKGYLEGLSREGTFTLPPPLKPYT